MKALVAGMVVDMVADMVADMVFYKVFGMKDKQVHSLVDIVLEHILNFLNPFFILFNFFFL